ncbi:serine/threonine-protein kinase [Allonocardiopsis opalescens]|uniref:non-specific serine/threonine protein kinase n=1 Tax=Allonocardiopsis opalescens TaxID=1144618 RepID=A0A2T0QDC0_9ACTN|nr:serine/threonine-protein kinase [Allonocardiopsis opalescens]PRY01905.1 serine/threonine protein kinase [Allonocardiopsis opalescens]
MSQRDRLVAGRYQLLAPLGRGGMGAVWRARDTLLDRDVAVKEVLLPADLGEEERLRSYERTRREARLAAQLNQPSIVTIHDVVDDGGHPWIVMELVSGRSLQETVDATGPLPARRVAEIGLQLLDALEAAHALGVVHRDVKPANVQLADNGRVVLTDFGIATRDGDPSVTRTGALVGSPEYMAPERISGEGAGPAGDLWSLGATLYLAVEGRSPFRREGITAVIAAVMNQPPPPVVRAGPLAGVLSGLLDKDPARRFDAARARAALAEAAGTAPARPAAPPATPPAGSAGHGPPHWPAHGGRSGPTLPPGPTGPAPHPAHGGRTVPATSAGYSVSAGYQPRPPRSGRPWTLAALIGIPVALVLALVGGVVVVMANSEAGAVAPPGGAASSPAPAATEPPPRQSPRGYRVESNAVDAVHYSVLVPDGWSVNTADETVTESDLAFRSYDSLHSFYVQYRDTYTDPENFARDTESWLEGEYDDYERERLEDLDRPGEWTVLDATFDYTAEGYDPQEYRTLVYTTVDASGNAFLLIWYSPADLWDALADEREAVMDSLLTYSCEGPSGCVPGQS